MSRGPNFKITPLPQAEISISNAKKLAPSDLSPDQKTIYESVLSWLKDPNASPYLKVGGLAGTGKTTLTSVLAAELQRKSSSVVFGAYTGKAASVLKRKLAAAGVGAPCGTLHSLIYQAEMECAECREAPSETHQNAGSHYDKSGQQVIDWGPALDGTHDYEMGSRVAAWIRRPTIEAGLIVVDEASMVGREIWDDLCSFGLPILAVGDHGQLPPIGRNEVNLMERPDLRLEQIHRQAAGNPILALAHFVRGGGRPGSFRGTGDDPRVRFAKTVPEALGMVGGADPLQSAVVVGTNKTRGRVNGLSRARFKRGGVVLPGDVVICLRNEKRTIFNGMRGVVREVGEQNDFTIEATVAFPDDGFQIKGPLSRAQFGAEKTFASYEDIDGPEGMGPGSWKEAGLLFDFGYGITAHKSQGSQFRDVIVCSYDANWMGQEYARWCYTAVSRAEERLVVI